MGRDPRVDEYISGAADFARPILLHLRELAHRVLPDATEAIKWGMPHFLVNGKNVAGMAAFKAHCTFVIHGDGRQGDASADARTQAGRIAAIADLPPEDELVARLVAARERVLRRGTAVRTPSNRTPRAEIPVPADFSAALDADEAARRTFDGFAPSHRREYLEWITGARTAPTRERRIAQAVSWLAQGRKRNWKYEKC